MAQLKDTIISGSMRITDTLYSTTNQLTNLNIPTSSNANTFGPGTNGQFIKSNGTSVFWETADSSISTGSSSTNVTTSKAVADFVEGKGYAFNNEIASILPGTTASKAYAVNDILIYNDQLYQVTTAISSGGVITPDSNCVAIKLDDIMIKNSDLVTTTTNGIMLAEDKEKLDNENKAIYRTIENQTVINLDDGIENAYLKNYTINIEPKQDLHGYNKPWANGTGKNVLPGFNSSDSSNGITWNALSDGSILINGTASALVTIDAPVGTWMWDGTTQYMLSGCPSGGNYSNGYYLRVDCENMASLYSEEDIGNGVMLNGKGSAVISDHLCHFRIVIRSGCVCNNLIFKPQLELGTTVTEYEPYSNICPIEGYNEINTYCQNKDNLIIGPFIYGIWTDANGNSSSVLTGCRSQIFSVKPSTSYQLRLYGDSPYSISVVELKADKTFNKRVHYAIKGASPYTFAKMTTNSATQYAYVQIANFEGITISEDDIKRYKLLFNESNLLPIEYASHGFKLALNTSSITSSSVYGGTLTVNDNGTGTLIVDKCCITFDGTENWGEANSSQVQYIPKPSSPNVNLNMSIQCNMAEYCGAIASTYMTPGQIGWNANKTNLLINLGISNVSDLKSFLASNNMQCCFYLTTPSIYTFTIDQLTTFLGENTIWSDAGEISITYPTNLKGYIDCINTNMINNMVKELNYATTTEAGVVKIDGYGLQINNDGVIQTSYAGDTLIKAGTDNFSPIVASNLHKAVFYGLAKAANDTTQSQSNNAIGQYTDTAKLKIHTMLGINNLLAPILLSATASVSHAIDSLFYYNSKLYKTTVAIAQNGTITPNTNCIETTLVDNIVKNTDYASGTVGGVVKISSGLTIGNDGSLKTYQATVANIKAGTITYRPIVPNTQHIATFYGLAKAAGDATQSASDNAVGIYTDTARAAIINMLGIDKLIGNYLADTYADKTYEIGDLLTMGGKLYKVTAKINQNGVITPNTNCVLTSIMEGLINADLEEY